MTQISLPKTNQTGTNEWADVEDNDVAIRDVVNGNIDNGNLSASAAIAHSKLANSTAGNLLIANASGVITGTALSGDVTVGATGVTAIGANKVTGAMLKDDVVGAYRTLLVGGGNFAADAAAGTYTLDFDSGWDTALEQVTLTTAAAPPMIYLDDADYTISGRTTKLRLRAQLAANATAPGTITYTVGLYPITVAGAADRVTFTLGAVVAGSTAVITNPSASTITSAVGSDVNVPSDGLYVFGCVTSAQLANNSAVALTCQLQMRHT